MPSTRPPSSDASAARQSSAKSGNERSSRSIQTSIAPKTAAATHRAVTVTARRSATRVPIKTARGRPGRQPLSDGLREVRLDSADMADDTFGVERAGAQRRDPSHGLDVVREGQDSQPAPIP